MAPRRTLELAAGFVAVGLSLACCTLSSVDDEGLSVEITLVEAPPPSRSLTTDLGYEVTLARGYLAVSSVQIVACSRSAAASPGRRIWDEVASGLGIREARAHSTTSPTVLGVPGVLSLAPSSQEASVLGELRPPPARYCATRIALGPADHDAMGLPADGSMAGLTIHLEGTFVAPSGGGAVPFAWSAKAASSAEHGTDFELNEGAARVRQAVSADLTGAFDGIDMATADPAQGAARVAAALGASLRVDTR